MSYQEVVVNRRRGEVEWQSGNAVIPGPRFGRDCELLLVLLLLRLGLGPGNRTALAGMRE